MSQVLAHTGSHRPERVVAQMLDYAANAVVYWPVAKIQAELEQREGYQSELAALLEEGVEEEQFWQRVKSAS